MALEIKIENLPENSDAKHPIKTLKVVQIIANGADFLVFPSIQSEDSCMASFKTHAMILEDFLKSKGIPFDTRKDRYGDIIPQRVGQGYELFGAGEARVISSTASLYQDNKGVLDFTEYTISGSYRITLNKGRLNGLQKALPNFKVLLTEEDLEKYNRRL